MTSTFDTYMERVVAGERLSPDDIRDLAGTPDILPLGMLADTLRRQLHGTKTTFLRVATCRLDQSFADAVQPAAREVHITGSPERLAVAVTAVKTAKEIAGERTVSAFSWADVERLAGDSGPARVLDALRQAGLETIADLPLDAIGDVAAAVRRLKEAGFERLRLSVSRAPTAERADLLLRAARIQDEFGCIESLDPLPASLNAFRPTTGYEDVKMVAIGRLAAPNIPSIQVNWTRYGPKLAQVALTFGADDLYGISASDEAVEGTRRAPLEEIRRNIAAAGFEPAERDGHFATVS